MIIVYFGIIQTSWTIIEDPGELVNYIKEKGIDPTGRAGPEFLSDRSMHPE